MEAIRGAVSRCEEGGHKSSKGGCAEGPVPAAGLVRAGEMSQAAACNLFWHSARAGPGEGLSQPLQAPGEGADLFGERPCCLSTSCKDHPHAGTSPGAIHLSPGPAPSARGGSCLGSANATPFIGITAPSSHSMVERGRGMGGSLLPAGGG